jgi:hypothetical protein
MGSSPSTTSNPPRTRCWGWCAANARVTLGGPRGQTFAVRAGDVMVLPAGTGHCNAGASNDLLVVGAYPDGMEWDIRRGDSAERDEVRANIRAVPLPRCDPSRGRRFESSRSAEMVGEPPAEGDGPSTGGSVGRRGCGSSVRDLEAAATAPSSRPPGARGGQRRLRGDVSVERGGSLAGARSGPR